jgi:hypothetical protein
MDRSRSRSKPLEGKRLDRTRLSSTSHGWAADLAHSAWDGGGGSDGSECINVYRLLTWHIVHWDGSNGSKQATVLHKKHHHIELPWHRCVWAANLVHSAWGGSDGGKWVQRQWHSLSAY